MPINNPLIIAGNPIFRQPFTGISPFYSRYEFQISNATDLDIASALGAVRRANSASLSDRRRYLEATANNFKFDDSIIEHVVRMTGMPILLIRQALQDVRRIFQEIPTTLSQRFNSYPESEPIKKIIKREIIGQEIISSHVTKLLHTDNGFCYAVTPGNDPRATAIVAANLGYLGIPFIIRASMRDAVAPIIIQTMVEAGYDPHFCNLIYLDRDSADFTSKHFKILDACSYIWTFGPSESIDQTLRYSINENTHMIDLAKIGYSSSDTQSFRKKLEHLSEVEFNQLIQAKPQRTDHFLNKVVIRHESGNCAAILNGSFDDKIQQLIYPSIGYANVCTAMKSLMVIADSDQTDAIKDMLSNLVVGDPLHPTTQVGYIDYRNLDYLARLVKNNSLHMHAFGGERLSTFQAKPLMITSQEDLPDFLGQEIPAYVLTTRTCKDVEEAIEQLNKHLHGNTRLGVSLLHFSQDQIDFTISQISAHIVLINKPTSYLLPSFHEGNDYSHLLTKGKMIYH